MWEILGISPTSDIKAIKRAYAAKLKQTHPQDDPVAFQSLRQAYDWALKEAKFIKDDLFELTDEVAAPQPLSHVLEPDVLANNPSNQLEIQITTANIQPAIEPLIEPKPVSNNEIKIEALDPTDKSINELEAPSINPDPPKPALLQQAAPNLFQESKSHANALLKLLEETDEAQIKSTLTAFFEQDWFIHIDAKAMLEAHLIKNINASRISPSYKVFAALMEYFDWGNETLIRNHDDDKVMYSIRWQFRYAREINAIKTAKEKGWSKARFLALVKNPPKPMAFRFYAFNLLIYEEAQRKLKLWDEEFPDIYAYLNPESVAWWRDKLAGNIGPLFNFGSRSILHFFGASFIASVISVVIATFAGFFDLNSPAYQVITWVLTIVLFLWYSMHRDKSSEIAPYSFPHFKALMTYLRQLIQTRHGRLIGLCFVAVNNILMLLSFNGWVSAIAIFNLYFALLVWLDIEVFKWALFAGLSMLIMAEYVPPYFNNKLSLLHLLGVMVSGSGFQKISQMNEHQQWGKNQHEFIFGLWLFLMLVLPIILYVQMPWLIEKLSHVTAYLTWISIELLGFISG